MPNDSPAMGCFSHLAHCIVPAKRRCHLFPKCRSQSWECRILFLAHYIVLAAQLTTTCCVRKKSGFPAESYSLGQPMSKVAAHTGRES